VRVTSATRERGPELVGIPVNHLEIERRARQVLKRVIDPDHPDDAGLSGDLWLTDRDRTYAPRHG
jgi:hypothetical protein